MMVKRFDFDLDIRQVSFMFAPVRSKLEVVHLLMKTIKIMLINEKLPAESVSGKLILIVSKMSRLFFISENKYLSINFPFSVIEESGLPNFRFKNGEEIDNKFTSDVLGIISSPDALVSFDIYDFLDPILEITEDDYNFWYLLRELMLLEDGYIRFDCDPLNANGCIHPENHLDVFYSSSNTFKVGLNSRMTPFTLIDLLNTNTDCHFLNTPTTT